jgi:hypothetical protein
MRLYLIALLTFACSLFDTMRDNGARAISEEHFKKVHGIQSAEVGIEEWTHDVSLRLFEIREKYGSPLSNMEKNEKRILQRRAIIQYRKDKEEKERIKAESEMPRKLAKSFCDHQGCRTMGFKVSMTDRGIIFCKDCPDPRIEGSFIPTWNCHYNPSEFTVNGALVYAVPNDGSTEVRNPEDVLRRIALVIRGNVSLVQKVRVAQDAGARAVIIIDSDCSRVHDGLRCDNEAFAKETNNGFSKGDPRSEWEKIRIPAVMVSKENGKRIHDMMDLESMEAFGGVHFYDRLLNDE